MGDHGHIEYQQHDGPHCHDKKDQQCHKIPKEQEHEECYVDYEIVVDVTYIEECQYVTKTYRHEEQESRYHHSRIVGHDSRVVDEYHKSVEEEEIKPKVQEIKKKKDKNDEKKKKGKQEDDPDDEFLNDAPQEDKGGKKKGKKKKGKKGGDEEDEDLDAMLAALRAEYDG